MVDSNVDVEGGSAQTTPQMTVPSIVITTAPEASQETHDESLRQAHARKESLIYGLHPIWDGATSWPSDVQDLLVGLEPGSSRPRQTARHFESIQPNESVRSSREYMEMKLLAENNFRMAEDALQRRLAAEARLQILQQQLDDMTKNAQSSSLTTDRESYARAPKLVPLPPKNGVYMPSPLVPASTTPTISSLDSAYSTARPPKRPATFHCSLCPKRFTRAHNLRSHLRTHTDERPFVCTFCGKAFARLHDCKKHEGLHSGETEFVCKGSLSQPPGQTWGCGRRFARADALGRHFVSEYGQTCIKPLLDEEARERTQNPAANWELLTLPDALLAQHPALKNVDWNTLATIDDDFRSGNEFAAPEAQPSHLIDSTYDSGYYTTTLETTRDTECSQYRHASPSNATNSPSMSLNVFPNSKQDVEPENVAVESSGPRFQSSQDIDQGEDYMIQTHDTPDQLSLTPDRLSTVKGLSMVKDGLQASQPELLVHLTTAGPQEGSPIRVDSGYNDSTEKRDTISQGRDPFVPVRAVDTDSDFEDGFDPPSDLDNLQWNVQSNSVSLYKNLEKNSSTLAPISSESHWSSVTLSNDQRDQLVGHASKPSDSGYQSGLGTDTESVCSSNSLSSSLGLPQNFLQDFIAVLGDALIQKARAQLWAASVSAQKLPEEFDTRLNAMLKQYSLDLSLDAHTIDAQSAVRSPSCPSDLMENRLRSSATKLVRRYRPKISRYLRENAIQAIDNPQSLTSRLQALGRQLSLNEKFALFARKDASLRLPGDKDFGRHEELEDDDMSNEGSDEEILDLEPIKDFLVAGDAFKKLSKALRTLYFDEMGVIDHVRREVSMQLSTLTPRCQNCSSMLLASETCVNHELVHSIDFSVRWMIREFVSSQCDNIAPKLGSTVVLVGSAFYAQATTLSKYIAKVWPTNGSKFLDALQAAVEHGWTGKPSEDHDSQTHNSIQFELSMKGTSDHCFVSGTEEFVIEIAQLLAFTGAALSLSPYDENLAYCKVRLDSDTQTSTRVSMSFNSEKLHPSEEPCWLPLFCGASIARDFPIPERGDELGLEMPIEMMAAITGARHAVEYEGGVVLKGFSSMFVPIDVNEDCIQWHLICSKHEDTRLSYRDVPNLCPERASLEKVNLKSIHTTRAIVGWCSVAWSTLGSTEVDFNNIDYSTTQQSNVGMKISGGSLGFQQFGLAQFDFSLGAKDGKCHFQRTGGPYKRLVSVAEKTPVILHDTLERRAWLVPASEVLLHMIHHRHALEPFELNDEPVKLLSTTAEGMTVREILLQSANMDLSDVEVYKFKDVITSTWSLLEFLVDQRVCQDQIPGVTVPSRMQDVARGFEFKAIVEERSPFRQKQCTVLKSSGGWPTLAQDIDALVLFASGFGDIIRPVREHIENQNLCHMWSTMPKGKDYLAASVKSIDNLYDTSGYRFERTYLTSTHLRWHKGNSVLFEPCRVPGAYRCRCSRLQQIVTKSAVGEINPPGPLVEGGAVIFGQSELVFPNFIETFSKPKRHSIYGQPNTTFATTVTTPQTKSETYVSDESEDDEMSNSNSNTTEDTATSWTSYGSSECAKLTSNNDFRLNKTRVEDETRLEDDVGLLAVTDLQTPLEELVHLSPNKDCNTQYLHVNSLTRGTNSLRRNISGSAARSVNHMEETWKTTEPSERQDSLKRKATEFETRRVLPKTKSR